VVALGIRSEPYVKRLLVPSAALLWGLQIAFLSPALALILVTLYDASTAQVGWILTVYNASGFVASLLVPSYADRRQDYLRPMLACGVLTLILALVLALTTSLPVAVVALVVVGGPAGVGLTLFQQMIPRPGLSTGLYTNTRRIGAIVSGPIIALGSTTALGNRGIFLVCGLLTVLVLVVIATAARQRAPRPTADVAR
jgi:MFS transporter, SET family, sugar efflux transporter